MGAGHLLCAAWAAAGDDAGRAAQLGLEGEEDRAGLAALWRWQDMSRESQARDAKREEKLQPRAWPQLPF